MVRRSEDVRVDVTILLSGHPDVVHSYHFAAGYSFDEGEAKMDEVTNLLTMALRGDSPVIALENPSAVYAARQVVGYKVTGLGSAQLEQIVADANRQPPGFSLH